MDIACCNVKTKKKKTMLGCYILPQMDTETAREPVMETFRSYMLMLKTPKQADYIRTRQGMASVKTVSDHSCSTF